MSTVLVTGAAGYVGGTVVRALLGSDPEARVVGVDWCQMAHGDEGVKEILDDPRFELVRADVRDTDTMTPLLERVDSVVHLAAIVGDPACAADPELATSVNLDASRRLVAAAKSRVGHFVFVSTCSNYGISDSEGLAKEDDPLNPISLYAETKVAVERLVVNGNGFPGTCLRLATVYGAAPRMRFDLTVNQFTMEALLNRRLTIYGDQFWRPYVHVEDVAQAVVATLTQPGATIGRTFNVGSSSENYTKRMMFDLLKQRLSDLDAEWIPGGVDRRSYRVSFERIRKELGFVPKYRVPDGMDELIGLAEGGAYANPWAERHRNV